MTNYNNTIILQGIVGSQAYGLATPESDIDRLGVFVVPIREKIALRPPEETHVSKDDLGDITLHELSKFMKLCANANPTIMELLWLDSYTTQNPYVGKSLVETREAFLSKRVVDSYTGYAYQQACRLLSREGTFASDLGKRTEKHGRHCWRLLIQGTELIRTGKLTVRLSDKLAQECRDAGKSAAENPKEFYDAVKARCRSVKDAGQGVLPDSPDWDELEKLAWNIRETLHVWKDMQ